MLIISFFLSIIALLWLAILLARARDEALPLPNPATDCPTFALWLPKGGSVPKLSPVPVTVVLGETPPTQGEYVLVLAPNVAVPPNIPLRFAGTKREFVSVFVRPSSEFWSLCYERLRRDFGQAAWVNDPKNPAAFADERCAWFRRQDLELPGVGQATVLRIARARKAHGLSVGLYSGYEIGDDCGSIRANGLSWKAIESDIQDWFDPQPNARWLIAFLSIFMWGGPLLGLFFVESRDVALLALCLAIGQRICAALYDGFSWLLILVAPFFEPWFWSRVAVAYKHPSLVTPPNLEAWESPTSIAPSGKTKWEWLDESEFVYTARRLGGSARVMELLYQNQPRGFTRRGQMVDRWIHQSPAARAVRFRCLMVRQLLSELVEPRALMSLPSGSGRDMRNVSAPNVFLVDMDSAALAAARANVPRSTCIQGSFPEVSAYAQLDGFVYCGLSEYLSDKEVVIQLRQIRDMLSANGVLIASTTQIHPQRELMRTYVGWHTRTRAATNFRGLLELAGFRVEGCWQDPHDIQTVFKARALEIF